MKTNTEQKTPLTPATAPAEQADSAAKKAYVAPRVISYSAAALEKETPAVNACVSFTP